MQSLVRSKSVLAPLERIYISILCKILESLRVSASGTRLGHKTDSINQARFYHINNALSTF
ncbi:hypothetical protein [uncultured Helicobacter sp.]|uniref:hypothetical protein n=1 Tax=uncultured Helicobacter sp. TaxID=175537 RepID=UPI00374E2D01